VSRLDHDVASQLWAEESSAVNLPACDWPKYESNQSQSVTSRTDHRSHLQTHEHCFGQNYVHNSAFDGYDSQSTFSLCACVRCSVWFLASTSSVERTPFTL